MHPDRQAKTFMLSNEFDLDRSTKELSVKMDAMLHPISRAISEQLELVILSCKDDNNIGFEELQDRIKIVQRGHNQKEVWLDGEFYGGIRITRVNTSAGNNVKIERLTEPPNEITDLHQRGE